jgi:hypothetical protein
MKSTEFFFQVAIPVPRSFWKTAGLGIQDNFQMRHQYPWHQPVDSGNGAVKALHGKFARLLCQLHSLERRIEPTVIYWRTWGLPLVLGQKQSPSEVGLTFIAFQQSSKPESFDCVDRSPPYSAHMMKSAPVRLARATF